MLRDMSGIFWITAAAIILRLGVQTVLALLNLAETRRRRARIPDALTAVMDQTAYRKAGDYTEAKLRFALAEHVWDALVLALVLFSALLPYAWSLWTSSLGASAWASAFFLVAILLLLAIPGLPWEWWAQFRLEEKFGFNRSTVRLWIVDHVKGGVLSVLIGAPVLWVLIVIVDKGGAHWWLWAWGALTAIKLVLTVAFPWLIMPLFNKFTPLADGELRSRLQELADRGGFRTRAIHVMDGSKRSAHSNAFFTGFGRFRRIVLFDSLVGQLAPEELEAVLAHEIGHYRKGHIWKGLALSAVMTLAGFILIGWLMESPAFFAAFGFGEPSTAIAFLLFGLLAGVFGFLFTPLGNVLSRRHEYEADAFARTLVGSPEPLVQALSRLARENLTNLTPHPAFSAFYYSHPTLLERVTALRRADAAAAPA